MQKAKDKEMQLKKRKCQVKQEHRMSHRIKDRVAVIVSVGVFVCRCIPVYVYT